ncbi:MAG: hypothetical protein J5965_25010, partial [Aeriscardovia sp.]|nr:hypothetical protein [Aeriscardovia sp.]
KPFYEVTKELTGREGWQWAGDKFELDEDVSSVSLRVVNLTQPCSGDGIADYAIDDITFQVCTPPDVDVSSSLTAEQLLDLCTDNPLTLSADITDDAKKFYGSSIAYLFQYTYQNPTEVDENDIEWHDLALSGGESILDKGEYTIEKPADHAAFSVLADGEEKNIYFRVVIGERNYLQNKRSIWEKMSATSPCRAVSISSIPIIAALNCAACTEPNEIEFINVDTKKAVKSVKLCKGESVTLTTNNLVPSDPEMIMSNDFKGFTIEWYKDDAVQKSLSNSPIESAISNTITYGDNDKAGKTIWKVRASDPDFPESSKCIKEAEIVVEFLEQPKVENLTFEFCEGQPGATDVLPTAKTGEEYTYYQDIVDLLAGVGTASPVKAPVFSDLKAGVHEFQYTLTSADGCVSEPASITITVNAIPEYQVEAIEPFCAKQSTVAALPVADADGKYSIEWTPAATAADLNALDGKSDPYKLTYVVSDAKTGCKAEPQEYEFTVMLATTVKLTATADCGETTVSAVTTPAGATLTYYSDDAPSSEKTVFKFGEDVAEWKAVATATGYCQSADSIEVTVMAVPGLVTTADPSCYLKSKAASFTDVQTQCAPSVVAASYDASAPENKGAALEWRLAGATDWSSTAPTPTVKDATSPAEETIDYEVRLKNTATGCYGETAKFTAHIYGAPVPKVTSAEYCKGAPAGPLSERVTINNEIPDTYTLKVYTDKDKTNAVDMTTAPSTATPGVVTYYATQTGQGGESDPVPFTVTTYGVDLPTV